MSTTFRFLQRVRSEDTWPDCLAESLGRALDSLQKSQAAEYPCSCEARDRPGVDHHEECDAYHRDHDIVVLLAQLHELHGLARRPRAKADPAVWVEGPDSEAARAVAEPHPPEPWWALLAYVRQRFHDEVEGASAEYMEGWRDAVDGVEGRMVYLAGPAAPASGELNELLPDSTLKDLRRELGKARADAERIRGMFHQALFAANLAHDMLEMSTNYRAMWEDLKRQLSGEHGGPYGAGFIRLLMSTLERGSTSGPNHAPAVRPCPRKGRAAATCWAHGHERTHAEVAVRGVSHGHRYSIVCTADEGAEPVWLAVVKGLGMPRYDATWPLAAVEHEVLRFIAEAAEPLPAGAC